eukprot:scaffold99017_cov33-Tisochrysis_lutea.AAC.1
MAGGEGPGERVGRECRRHVLAGLLRSAARGPAPAPASSTASFAPQLATGAERARPITLLQSDYKILAKILTNRLSKVIGKIISENQMGFVPRRLISEATHLLQLTRAYLDETGEPGLLLALD